MEINDRVAYAAKFLKSINDHSYHTAQRRGTFIGPDAIGQGFARVRWDDEATLLASGEGSYAEADYCDDVRKHGSLVHIKAIAKVGSTRFALNDL